MLVSFETSPFSQPHHPTPPSRRQLYPPFHLAKDACEYIVATPGADNDHSVLIRLITVDPNLWM